MKRALLIYTAVYLVGAVLLSIDKDIRLFPLYFIGVSGFFITWAVSWRIKKDGEEEEEWANRRLYNMNIPRPVRLRYYHMLDIFDYANRNNMSVYRTENYVEITDKDTGVTLVKIDIVNLKISPELEKQISHSRNSLLANKEHKLIMAVEDILKTK